MVGLQNHDLLHFPLGTNQLQSHTLLFHQVIPIFGAKLSQAPTFSVSFTAFPG